MASTSRITDRISSAGPTQVVNTASYIARVPSEMTLSSGDSSLPPSAIR